MQGLKLSILTTPRGRIECMLPANLLLLPIRVLPRDRNCAHIPGIRPRYLFVCLYVIVFFIRVENLNI